MDGWMDGWIDVWKWGIPPITAQLTFYVIGNLMINQVCIHSSQPFSGSGYQGFDHSHLEDFGYYQHWKKDWKLAGLKIDDPQTWMLGTKYDQFGGSIAIC